MRGEKKGKRNVLYLVLNKNITERRKDRERERGGDMEKGATE